MAPLEYLGAWGTLIHEKKLRSKISCQTPFKLECPLKLFHKMPNNLCPFWCLVCVFGPHRKENPIDVFLFWELCGLRPNFHIYVSVSDLYIPRIGPHISCSRKGRPIVGIYNSLTDTWTWKLGLRPRYSFSGNICFKFSAFCLCSVKHSPPLHTFVSWLFSAPFWSIWYRQTS